MYNKLITSLSLLALLLPLGVFSLRFNNSSEREKSEGVEKKFLPSEWFYTQRAASDGEIPIQKYYKAVEKRRQMALQKSAWTADWKQEGPSNVGGRITALDVDNQNNIIYAGAAAGGVLRSKDNGVSWEFLTDFAPSLSIGALKLSPDNPKIIYVGTGEANISTDSYAGFGMLKSTDGGNTWLRSGLDSSRHIAKIEIHPKNTNSVFAAVSGGLYSKSQYRGIYKSTDAGATWYRTLYLNDSTSAVDVVVDPNDTSRVYAAMWERLRGPTFRKAAGINSGVYLSTDGGWTWAKATSGLPVSDAKTGRISLAVAPSDPNIVYALYKTTTIANGSTNDFGGFYKSTNKGVSWSVVTQSTANTLLNGFSNFGWYFGEMKVDPFNAQKVYIGEVDFFVTTDGGVNWTNITNSYSGSFDQQHPDMHALWIDPLNTSHLICGNDGGVYESTNGTVWAKKYNLPISQFYASAIDYQLPSRLYGGLQDNGCVGTKTGALSEYLYMNGGDGFVCQVDYTNSNIIYMESQFGGLVKSIDGGATNMQFTTGFAEAGVRTNWCTPFIIDPIDPQTLYVGSYKLYTRNAASTSWTAISGDLTRGVNGRLGTITAISAEVSPTNSASRYIYVATDDAKLSVSTDGGTTWTDRTGSLPRRYMTDVLADKRNANIAYVTLSGYNLDEKTPRIFRTTDAGLTWTDISSALVDAPVNSIIIDYDFSSVLYVGTDVGVFYTTNGGTSWAVLGSKLPNSPVFDINYHLATHKLVAATHGRSLFSIDLTNLISGFPASEKHYKSFDVSQNYPNPFNPSTSVRIEISSKRNLIVKLFDITGKLVKELDNSVYEAGSHIIKIDGSSLRSGIYFVKINADELSKTVKIVLVK